MPHWGVRYWLMVKLLLTLIVPLGTVLGILLPLSFPITDPRYQLLPTLLPILGALLSGVAAGLVVFHHQSRQLVNKGALVWGCFAALIGFALTWYLAMFVVLNLKGS